MIVALPIPAIALEAVMVVGVVEPRFAVRSRRPKLDVLLAEYDHAMAEITVPVSVYEHVSTPCGGSVHLLEFS